MRVLYNRCWLLVLLLWQRGCSDLRVPDRILGGDDEAAPVPLHESEDSPAVPSATEISGGTDSGTPQQSSACTGLDDDPWATGKLNPCCGELEQCLGSHGKAGAPLSYKCVSNCHCTTENKDPWITGVQRSCCQDLRQCLGKHKTDRKLFYKCLKTCPVLAGTGWCTGEEPEAGFTLRQDCGNSTGNGTDVKVLSYNLYWWNLFGNHRGRNRSAGRLIARNGLFDIMGFQECEDVRRVLRDGGVAGSYDVLVGPGATAMVYNNATWELLDKGESYIAEDQRSQYFGLRAVQWARLQHTASNKTVFAANHHGPLPVNSGGLCGPQATAYNLLSVIRANAQEDDVVLLLGDFNADYRSGTQRALMGYLNRIAHFWVDAIFSSCPYRRAWRLGRGGSDHQAILAHFSM